MEEIGHEVLTAIVTALISGIGAYFKRRKDLKELEKKELLLTEEERDAIIDELPRETLKKKQKNH